jgi:hypothetical protein
METTKEIQSELQRETRKEQHLVDLKGTQME